MIINLWNIQHYVYNRNKTFIILKLEKWWKIQPDEINHNPNWADIPDYPYRILVIGGSGARTTNVLLNLTENQPADLDKIYSYVKDPVESKYQLLINGREKVVIENHPFII